MATRPLPSTTPTTRTVREASPSATWADVSKAVATGQDEVIVEAEGLPTVAVISLEEYAALRAAREQERKDAALRWLREFQESYDGRNDDLSEDEIAAIADEVARDAIDSMERKGIIRFGDEPEQ
ncbi:MAG: hypothetical protein WBA46_07220 [Thermomicrobiales bacterium]